MNGQSVPRVALGRKRTQILSSLPHSPFTCEWLPFCFLYSDYYSILLYSQWFIHTDREETCILCRVGKQAASFNPHHLFSSKNQRKHQEIYLFVCSVSGDWGERCILTQKAECAAAGSILCGFLGMVKILKLTVATLCSDCKSDFRGGCCIGCSSYPPSPKLKLTAM